MKMELSEGWAFCRNHESEKMKITLPHDAMLYEKRCAENKSGAAGAYFGGGYYEYEKIMIIPEEWKDKEISLFFEGVYPKAEIFVNDQEAGRIIYGYSEYSFRIEKLLYFGSENRILVKVDNKKVPNSRWYSGAGIYRPVHLIVDNPVHLVQDGIQITTISLEPPKIRIRTDHCGGSVSVAVKDNESVLASGQGKDVVLELSGARLWSDENPYLYTACIELYDGNKKTDYAEASFGIRKAEWSAEGLKINGKDVLLRGGCIHHDNGILGACAYPETEERRIRIMKEYGFNAVRCAHNPCSRALLDACDHLGMYVIDETWDMWYRSKTEFDYAERFESNYENDLNAMVRKDRNHPSVLLYSIGNEISEPAEEKGIAIARNIKARMHELDPSRMITAGINLTIIASTAEAASKKKEDSGHQDSGQRPDLASMDSETFNKMTQAVGQGMNMAANSEEADRATSPILDLLDVAGYNYASGRYPLEGEKHPGRIIYGSETFPQDIWKNWKMVKKYPYLTGDFMWAAWDYLGEAGCGAWSWHPEDKGFTKAYPWILAGSGAIDLTGYPTGEALYAKTVWGCSKTPEIAVRPVTHSGEAVLKSVWRGTNAIPCWSWKGCEGRKAVVEVYSDAAEIELRINGKSLERKAVSECRCLFETAYEKGTLEMVAYDETGKETGRNCLHSAEGDIRPQVYFENTSPHKNRIIYALICMADESGRIDAASDHLLDIQVKGGTLLGFGSGNPRTEENYVTGSFTTWYGRALAAIRADGMESDGTLEVTVYDAETGFKDVNSVMVNKSDGSSEEGRDNGSD